MEMTYTYFIWSVLLLLCWFPVYYYNKYNKVKMLKMSIFTLPLGLSEPLFYPSYWFPPTLFDLGNKTGFDIESLIFSFAVGGLGCALYDYFYGHQEKVISCTKRNGHQHRFHKLAISSPVWSFLLLELFTPWNAIYTASLALFIGAIGTLYCRPELKVRIVKSALMFSVFYFLFFSAMNLSHPNFVTLYWNHAQISGIQLLHIPIEELLFAFTFGAMWGGFYEHNYWLK
jgi:hypothetical protein